MACMVSRILDTIHFRPLTPLSLRASLVFHAGRVLGSICCDQSADTMRLGARLASTKLTLLPRSSTTSRTRDGEYLFGADRFHGKIMPQPDVQEWSILTSYNQDLLG